MLREALKVMEMRKRLPFSCQNVYSPSNQGNALCQEIASHEALLNGGGGTERGLCKHSCGKSVHIRPSRRDDRREFKGQMNRGNRTESL